MADIHSQVQRYLKMTQDECIRKKRILEENLFFFELEKNNGNLESLLSKNEREVYEKIPEFHKELLKSSYLREFAIKKSLEPFNKKSTCFSRQVADLKIYIYYKNICNIKKSMTISDIRDLLFPLQDIQEIRVIWGEYFTEKTIELIGNGELEPIEWFHFDENKISKPENNINKMEELQYFNKIDKSLQQETRINIDIY